MAIAVWNTTIYYPVKWWRESDRRILTPRPGYERIVMHEKTHSRADGSGAVSSYSGRNMFQVQALHSDYAGSEKFKTELAFIQARYEDGSAFYFYNPRERATPDGTGVDTTGRYLVKLLAPTYGATMYAMKLHNWEALILSEFFGPAS